jgi:hypothetical protein
MALMEFMDIIVIALAAIQPTGTDDAGSGIAPGIVHRMTTRQGQDK